MTQALRSINNVQNYGTKFAFSKQQQESNPKTSEPILSFNKAKSDSKENTKSFLKKYGMTIGLGLTAAITGFAIFKNIKMSKQLADVTTKLAQTTTELNKTKAALSEAEGFISHIAQIVNTPEKRSIGETLTKIINKATSGLKTTNELGREVSQFLSNAKSIKSFIA